MMSLEDISREILASALLSAEELSELRHDWNPGTADEFIARLLSERRLTAYQWQQIRAGQGASLVLGNYVVEDAIGQGGMGLVLKARHRRMKRLVALKVISSALLNQERSRLRFQREVEAAAKLSHPNIVQAFDADEVRGLSFLVMEFVPGSDLTGLIRRQGPMSIETALNCIQQAAIGLAYAHEQGIIHRDIKPSNLLVADDGQVKILDMGLARLLEDEGQHQLTTASHVMGTIDFMAPEQAEDSHEVGPAADIYSLGCTLYFLLAGKCMYEGPSLVQRMLAHREQPIPALASLREDVADALETLFARMVAKSPESRFATSEDVVRSIAEMGISNRTDSLKASLLASEYLIADQERRQSADFASGQASTLAELPVQFQLTGSESLSPTIPTGSAEESTGTQTVIARSGLASAAPAGSHSSRRWWGLGVLIFLLCAAGILALRPRQGDPTVKHIERQTNPPDENPSTADAPADWVAVELAKSSSEAERPARLPASGQPSNANESDAVSDRIPYAADRAVAAWALKQKCDYLSLELREIESGASSRLHHGDRLPDGPFKLCELNLVNSPVRNHHLEQTAGLTGLHTLGLSGTFIDESSGSYLEQLPLLAMLNVSHTRFQTSAFGNHPRLSELWIVDYQIDDNWDFLQRLPLLRLLSIGGNDLPRLQNIGQYSQLRVLHLRSFSELDQADVDALQKANPRLTIMLGDDAKARVVGEDRQTPWLRRWLASGVKIDGYDEQKGEFRRLADADLDRDFAPFFVHKLEFPEWQFTTEDCDALSHFGGSLHHIGCFGTSGVDDVAEQLAQHGRLRTASFISCDLSDVGLRHLEHAWNLQGINLSDCPVSPSAVEEFRRQVPGCACRSADYSFLARDELPPAALGIRSESSR